MCMMHIRLLPKERQPCLFVFAIIVSLELNRVHLLLLFLNVYNLYTSEFLCSSGIGFGLMYLPAIVAVSVYFEERRAFATGIAVCGSGIGTFILAPLTDFLLYEYNWSWTLLILGGLILNGIVFGALVRPLELQKDGAAESKYKARPGDLGDRDGTSYRDSGKRPPEASSNGVSPPESVPLITLTDEQDKTLIVSARATERRNPPQVPTLFFYSTPNMHNSGSPTQTTVCCLLISVYCLYCCVV